MTSVIVLPDWPQFKPLNKDLKLLRQILVGEKVFVRPSPTGNYDGIDGIKCTWRINY